MTVQLTIRNAPDEVRDELAARAARRGKSMQEYLRMELERIASRPAVDDVVTRIRQRKSATGTVLLTEDLLLARDADRR